MNEHELPFRVRDDEPAVTNPRLRELVELARGQRLPPLRSELKTINERVAQQRRGRARVTLAAALLAAAAVALVWTVRERPVPLDERGPAEQAERSLEGREGGVAIEPVDRRGQAHVRDAGVVDGETVVPPVEVAPPVEVVPPPVVEPQVEPEVPPVVEPTPRGVTEPRKAVPDASELARQAEDAMKQQRRGDAIRALTTLVRRYPTSSAARAALLDLGRLLRADGRRDEARCAYRQLVARWPADPMRAEIDRVLETLGDGPGCKGLRPR